MSATSPSIEPAERIAVSGPLTEMTVAALRAELLERLPANGPVSLDLAAVRDIDLAGLQLLLSVRCGSQARGFTLASVPVPVATLAAALGLDLTNDAGI